MGNSQARHLHRLLTLFDPLLRLAPFLVEPHHRPAMTLFCRDIPWEKPISLQQQKQKTNKKQINEEKKLTS